ncbi:hypothetical protein LXL04_038586 [Taraxacum kok-saghyz]
MYIRYCVIEFIYGVFAFWNSQQPVSAPVPHGLSDFLYEDEEVIDERKWIEYWDKWTPDVSCLLLSEASIEPIEFEVEVLLSEEMPDSAHLSFCMADEGENCFKLRKKMILKSTMSVSRPLTFTISLIRSKTPSNSCTTSNRPYTF